MDVIELIRENQLADEFVVNAERNLKEWKCYENWKEAILSQTAP